MLASRAVSERDGSARPLARDDDGPADAPAALLLHDLTGDRRVWRALAGAMSGEFRVIAPDLRGFGESGPLAHGETPSLRDHAADLAALLDGEGIARCALIGAGFGAEAALEFALAEPERARLLVLSGAAPAPDHPAYDEAARAHERRRAEEGRLAGRFGMGRAAALAAESLGGAEARAALRARYGRIDAEAFAAACRARAERGDALPRLASLGVPALVLAGESDPLLAAARRLAETLPRARLETLPDCGAGAPFTAPRAFEAALGAFLGDMRAGADGW